MTLVCGFSKYFQSTFSVAATIYQVGAKTDRNLYSLRHWLLKEWKKDESKVKIILLQLSRSIILAC